MYTSVVRSNKHYALSIIAYKNRYMISPESITLLGQLYTIKDKIKCVARGHLCEANKYLLIKCDLRFNLLISESKALTEMIVPPSHCLCMCVYVVYGLVQKNGQSK